MERAKAFFPIAVRNGGSWLIAVWHNLELGNSGTFTSFTQVLADCSNSSPRTLGATSHLLPRRREYPMATAMTW